MSILELFLLYRTVILTKGAKVSVRLKNYISILIVLCLVGCGENKKPEGLLSRDEMVSLMVDIYLAEARISTTGLHRDTATKLFKPYERSLIEGRGITDSVLRANYSYYLQQPEELEKILDAVIDTLNLREQRPVKP